MAAVLAALWEAGAQVKLLGSYPEWQGEQVVAPFDQPPMASVRRSRSEVEQTRHCSSVGRTPAGSGR